MFNAKRVVPECHTVTRDELRLRYFSMTQIDLTNNSQTLLAEPAGRDTQWWVFVQEDWKLFAMFLARLTSERVNACPS